MHDDKKRKNYNNNNKLSEKKIRKKRKSLRILAISLSVFSILIVGLYFGIPEAARYLVRSELSKLGMSFHRGSRVHWNIFTSEMYGGPVEFWSADAEPGVIETVRLKYNLEHLLDRRASLQTIILEGIDLQMKRKMDGTFTLNGINLSEFLTAEPDRPEEPESNPWGVGVDDLVFEDSRLIFVDEVTNGTLVLAIERLDLGRFRSWEPETPGRFDLKGSTNGIQLLLKGEATPFADVITVSVEGDLNGATLEKVAKFTGPLGLERQGGVLNARIETDLNLVDGRVEETTTATLKVTDLDVGGAKIGGMAVDEAHMDIDIQTVSYPDRTNKVNGSIGLTLGATKLRGGGRHGSESRWCGALFERS